MDTQPLHHQQLCRQHQHRLSNSMNTPLRHRHSRRGTATTTTTTTTTVVPPHATTNTNAATATNNEVDMKERMSFLQEDLTHLFDDQGVDESQ